MIRIAITVLIVVLMSTRVVAAGSERLSFNGTVFARTAIAEKRIVFKALSDPERRETITVRSVVSNGKFDDVSQAFIAQIKMESGDAKLLVMEKAITRELVVASLRELEHNKMLYKVERLSAAENSPPVSVAYSSEFKVRDASEKSDAKAKVTAMKALATFDMNRARQLLHAKQ